MYGGRKLLARTAFLIKGCVTKGRPRELAARVILVSQVLLALWGAKLAAGKSAVYVWFGVVTKFLRQ